MQLNSLFSEIVNFGYIPIFKGGSQLFKQLQVYHSVGFTEAYTQTLLKV